jgi:hypothetical protein
MSWNNRTRLQPVQFEWEEEPQPRAVRLTSINSYVAVTFMRANYNCVYRGGA